MWHLDRFSFSRSLLQSKTTIIARLAQGLTMRHGPPPVPSFQKTDKLRIALEIESQRYERSRCVLLVAVMLCPPGRPLLLQSTPFTTLAYFLISDVPFSSPEHLFVTSNPSHGMPASHSNTLPSRHARPWKIVYAVHASAIIPTTVKGLNLSSIHA